MQKYDLIIIGAGPAGLTAAIYAARYNLKTLVIGHNFGGLAAEANVICNFPSYSGIKGIELMQKMKSQLKNLGVEIKTGLVEKVKKSGPSFLVKIASEEYAAKKIILATGSKKRKLGLKREQDFLGKGISYCAVCDAAFYKNKTVGVVGGGNAALTAALLLAEFAKKVYIIYRRDKFYRAEPAWIRLVEKNKKIHLIFNSDITELCGRNTIEKIKLSPEKELDISGLFVEIGFTPNSGLAKSLGAETDEKGHIKTGKKQKTNIKGVFAAGDVTNNHLKQVITACAEGAIAAAFAYEEIKKAA